MPSVRPSVHLLRDYGRTVCLSFTEKRERESEKEGERPVFSTMITHQVSSLRGVQDRRESVSQFLSFFCKNFVVIFLPAVLRNYEFVTKRMEK